MLRVLLIQGRYASSPICTNRTPLLQVYYVPLHLRSQPLVLHLPHFRRERRTFVRATIFPAVFIPERALVAVVPFLEGQPCQPDVSIRVSIPSQDRSVDVFGFAVTRYWIVCLVLLQSIASCLFARFCLVNHICIVLSNFCCQAACTGVTHFDSMAIEVFVPECSLLEAFINYLHEPFSYFCLHPHIKWWIPPEDIWVPLWLFCSFLCTFGWDILDHVIITSCFEWFRHYFFVAVEYFLVAAVCRPHFFDHPGHLFDNRRWMV